VVGTSLRAPLITKIANLYTSNRRSKDFGGNALLFMPEAKRKHVKKNKLEKPPSKIPL
jgi:hypothetical protein